MAETNIFTYDATIGKKLYDKTFRRMAVADPRKALQTILHKTDAQQIPDDIICKVVTNTKTVHYFVLPEIAPDDNLALDQIQAGREASCVSSLGSVGTAGCSCALSTISSGGSLGCIKPG